MLSELITNWTIYANKVPAELFIPPVTLITNELVLLSYNPYMYVPEAALITFVVIVAIHLAVGILPNVDNFAHLGGFIAGFLLGYTPTDTNAINTSNSTSYLIQVVNSSDKLKQQPKTTVRTNETIAAVKIGQQQVFQSQSSQSLRVVQIKSDVPKDIS
ncbi:hypothetical protein ACET3Z_026671 [Daucus carota]